MADCTLREIERRAQVDLRADPSHAALSDLLPAAPGSARSVGERRTLWLGPDEWLVTGPPGSAAAIERELRDRLGDSFGSVVDVSANRTLIELAGPDSRELLTRGCAIDLHPAAFGPGSVAQTTIARVQVILEQTSDEPAYLLYARPSFAGHLTRWLNDAIEELSASAQAPSRSSIRRRQRSVRASSLNV